MIFVFLSFFSFWSFVFIFISKSCHWYFIIFLLYLILPSLFSWMYAFSISSLCKNQHFFGPNLHSSSFLHFDTSCMCIFLLCSFKAFVVRKFLSQKLHLNLGSEFFNVSLWRNQQLSPYKHVFSKYLLQCCTWLVCTILVCIMTSGRVSNLSSQNLQVNKEFSLFSSTSGLCVWSLKWDVGK